jgi:urease accessory protein
MTSAKRLCLSAILLLAASMPAYAHVAVGTTSSFTAGFMHSLHGVDHLTVMITVGLWAALKGGNALWTWPAAFVAVMLGGAMLGMQQVPLPFVEPGILASVVALGLLVALAVDLPVSAGVTIIGVFALFHGHAHGAEVAENAAGVGYLAGLAISTALLHAVGIAAGLGLGTRFRGLARAAGAAGAAVGVGLVFGAL